MTDFEILIHAAAHGDKEAMEEVLLFLEPIISRNSYISGREDEDLRQTIILKILVAIKIWERGQKSEE